MLAAMFLFLVGLGYLWGERRLWVLLVCRDSPHGRDLGRVRKGFAVQLPQGLFS